MFGPIYNFNQDYFLQACCSNIDNARRHRMVANHFNSVMSKGRFSRLMKRLVGVERWLYDLNELRQNLSLQSSSYTGIRVVPIDHIIGSESRVADFDIDFHPVHEHSRERWVNMALAFMAHIPLPPVDLIRVCDRYFVRDGHHRISVARSFGQIVIDSEVVTWKVHSPLPWQGVKLR